MNFDRQACHIAVGNSEGGGIAVQLAVGSRRRKSYVPAGRDAIHPKLTLRGSGGTRVGTIVEASGSWVYDAVAIRNPNKRLSSGTVNYSSRHRVTLRRPAYRDVYAVGFAPGLDFDYRRFRFAACVRMIGKRKVIVSHAHSDILRAGIYADSNDVPSRRDAEQSIHSAVVSGGHHVVVRQIHRKFSILLSRGSSVLFDYCVKLDVFLYQRLAVRVGHSPGDNSAGTQRKINALDRFTIAEVNRLALAT